MKNDEKEIKTNQPETSTEKYSLNDDRRVKALSPGALVTKRFFRNRIAVIGMGILIFMFVFSFIGGLISPYGQDQFFYREEAQRKEFAAVTQNTEFRYATSNASAFDSSVQAQTMLAIIQGKSQFYYDGASYKIEKEGQDFYSVSLGGEVLGICFKDIVNSTTGTDQFSFDFKYNALKAFANEKKSFNADGVKYEMDEKGNILKNGKETAYVSRYIVKALMPDIVLSRDFKDKLLSAIEANEKKFTYTDENLIVEEENTEEPMTDSADSTGMMSENMDMPAENMEMPEDSKKENKATAEYDIEFKASKNTWEILQSIETHKYDTYSEPSKAHWFGTDKYGMDMLTRLMYGGRVSLLIGFIVVFIETALGVILGGVAGYFGGWIDGLIMRMVDIFYCLPSMPIIIILGAAMDAQRVDPTMRMIYLMLILGILGWAAIARLVRGQILTLREQEFMTATEATGIKISSRIFKHLIPNVIPQLIVNCTMSLGGVIITEATLSFLGLGVKFPFASWGNIINDVNNTFVLTTYWFIWIPAGVLLLLTVLAFNLVGDGLRDAFDPKMKR